MKKILIFILISLISISTTSLSSSFDANSSRIIESRQRIGEEEISPQSFVEIDISIFNLYEYVDISLKLNDSYPFIFSVFISPEGLDDIGSVMSKSTLNYSDVDVVDFTYREDVINNALYVINPNSYVINVTFELFSEKEKVVEDEKESIVSIFGIQAMICMVLSVWIPIIIIIIVTIYIIRKRMKKNK